MDLFPEIYGGDVGITALQYAIGTADPGAQTNNTVVELFNPALTGTAQLLNAKLLTVTGIIVWGAQAAAQNLSVWNTTNSAVVAGATGILGPNWMDHRRSLASPVDVPLATLAAGNLASIATITNATEIMRTVLPASQGTPYNLPFNEDISPGTGILVTVAGATRSVVTVIWIERQQTA